jgi:hypothetical protein
MIRRNAHAPSRDLARLRRPQRARIHRPVIEALEGRTMLDSGGLPAAIAIGRTLAMRSTGESSTPAPAYVVHEARNHRVGISYTVSNQHADRANSALVTETREPGLTIASASRKSAPNARNLATNPGTSHHEDRTHVSRTAALGDVMPPTVLLSAPDVNGSNFDSLNPYTFSITYSDTDGVDRSSIWGAGIEVRPPVGSLLYAKPVSITPSGPIDSRGDAPRETATYQLTPPGGSWGTAPPGSYAVIVAGAPVTDVAGNPMVTGTAGTFSVRIGVRRLVVFAQPPGLVGVGSPFSLTVGMEDRHGNIVTRFHGSLSISMGSNPGGATLGGTLTANASGGVALFSGLTLNRPDAGYTLEVSGAGLHATTARFDAANGPIAYFDGPPGPRVVSTPALQKRGRLDEITLLYSTTMDPTTVTALKNYTLVDAGPDHEFGNKDDRAVPLKSATENAFGDEVTLALKRTVKPSDSFLLILNSQQPTGLRDSKGWLLNSWGPYATSWNEVLFLGRPPRDASDPSFQAMAGQLIEPWTLSAPIEVMVPSGLLPLPVQPSGA